ncbi:hypothetical protein ACOZ9X_17180 [Fictibacillus nanhaiensis]
MAYELSIWENKNHYCQIPQLNQQDMTNMLGAYAPFTSIKMIYEYLKGALFYFYTY